MSGLSFRSASLLLNKEPIDLKHNSGDFIFNTQSVCRSYARILLSCRQTLFLFGAAREDGIGKSSCYEPKECVM